MSFSSFITPNWNIFILYSSHDLQFINSKYSSRKCEYSKSCKYWRLKVSHSANCLKIPAMVGLCSRCQSIANLARQMNFIPPRMWVELGWPDVPCFRGQSQGCELFKNFDVRFCQWLIFPCMQPHVGGSYQGIGINLALCPAFWFVWTEPFGSGLLKMDNVGGGFLGGMLKIWNTWTYSDLIMTSRAF